MNYILFIFLLFFSCNQIFGQSTIPDESFGNKGLLTSSIDNYPSFGSSIATDDEGRMLVAGYISGYSVPDGNSGFIARYSSSGILDESFGENGVARIQVDGQSIIHDIKFHKGDIIFSGIIYHSTGNTAELYIGRLTSAGVFDTSFGNNGLIKSGLSSYILSCGQTSVYVNESDGITGVWYNKEKIIYVNRYQWNGLPDVDFNKTGKLVHNNYVCTVFCKPTYCRNSNKEILLAGAKLVDDVNYVYETFICLYSNSGIFIREKNIGDLGITQVVKADNNGNWYLACINFADYTPYIYLSRLKPDGSIDESFGQNGKATINIDKKVFSVSDMIIKENRIYMSGKTVNDTDLFTIAITTDGEPDQNFGENGVLFKQIKNKNNAVQLLLNDDGKYMYVCGYTYNSMEESSLFVLKYTIEKVPLSLEEKSKVPVSLYPNPCEEILHLAFNSSKARVIKIIDNKGIVVHKVSAFSTKEVINLKSLLAGIYIILIEDEAGVSTKHALVKK